MTDNKVELHSEGIKKALNNYNMYESIAEYVWNGFDAKATIVYIDIMTNELCGSESIEVIDNGYGIDFNMLNSKFKRVFESKKPYERANESYTSTFHGKNGVGRLTFFSFANTAYWTTIYPDDNNTNNEYHISIKSDTLELFTPTYPKTTTEPCGTRVKFERIDSKFYTNELIEFLKLEFAWYLKLKEKDNYTIIINGIDLDYSDILAENDSTTFTYEDSKTLFMVEYCRWNEKLNEEYSRYYYLNSNGDEMAKEHTSLNQKGDKFYHSVYIKSAFFDDFSYTKDDEKQTTLFSKTKSDSEFKFIHKEVDNYLREKRRPFIREYAKSYINELKKGGAFPKYNEKNPIEKFKRESLEEVIADIYFAQPTMFSSLNLIQKRTIVRVFDLVIDSGETESFFKILESVLDLTKEEKDEFANTLEYVKLSSISKVINLLKDRKLAVEHLKVLVFENEKDTAEVPHLQEFIEKHYWLFGEQYHLVTAEEPDFVEALRRFTYILSGENKTRKNTAIDHQHARKQMDIFAIQQMKDGDIKKCVVVELKRPSIILGRKELDQVKKYFDLILAESRFNAPNIQWYFYLVGNRYNAEITSEFKNAESHGERSLAFKGEKHRIYVKTWSEIITDFELNHDFIMSKLELEQKQFYERKNLTPEEIVKNQEISTAVRPVAIRI